MEDVPTAIEDGFFGMWDETGGMMNEAIQRGYNQGLGYYESLGKYIRDNPEKFKYRNDCVLYNAYINNIPATYHISMGTDIIHQHPSVDFAVLGGASGLNFKIFANTLKDLDGGVHLNIESSVQGPEIFLKTLSIVKYRLEDLEYEGNEIAIIGDGKVEIRIRIGGKTIGMAIEEKFQKKLIDAGAHIIVSYFEEKNSLINWIRS